MNCTLTATLAPVFGNHMVLQYGAPVPIFGTGDPHATVHVKLGEEKQTTQVGTDGRWIVWFAAHPAFAQTTLDFQCGSIHILVEDILFGDVWIAAGQSNMELEWQQSAEYAETCHTPGISSIRMYLCSHTLTDHQAPLAPQKGWIVDGDEAQRFFSAAGTYFARALFPHIHVPIGIVCCYWGGTSASTWLDETLLQQKGLNCYLSDYESSVRNLDLEKYEEQFQRWWEFNRRPDVQQAWEKLAQSSGTEKAHLQQLLSQEPVLEFGPHDKNRPGQLYHRMVEPLAPFRCKGVLWYQGESDEHHPDTYAQLLTSLIQCWRSLWNAPLPFLLVQLAPFGSWMGECGIRYPLMRQQQQLVSQTLSDVYLTSIMDCGSKDDIHPPRKRPVGERLALLARGCIYGENIVAQPPCFEKCSVKENCVSLYFSHTADGLSGTGIPRSLFITQDGRYLPPERAEIGQDTVRIFFSAPVEGTIHISFAWCDYTYVDLYNSVGLPALPFEIKVKI
ncbi:sialate O-acetylesterase [uncultured Ruthenibacterium sp.]|uniref:sialate O-acetylesterase n=1 Tax=uncultured Ruthenibacterium sp. TaxID=1905347 RepID=UPI00349EC253